MLVEWVFVALVHFGGPPQDIAMLVADKQFTSYPDCMVFGVGSIRYFKEELKGATVSGSCLEVRRQSF